MNRYDDAAKRKADQLVTTAERMLKEAEAIRTELAQRRYQYPIDPNWAYSKINVKFRGTGKWYRFLILRDESGSFYTTGNRSEHAKFRNWEAFIDWLRSDEVEVCSRLYRLDYAASSNEVQNSRNLVS